MKLSLLLGLCALTTCSSALVIPDDDVQSSISRTITINFPCNKFNGSDDWVECKPVILDLSEHKMLSSAYMTYILVTTRGSSHMIAELYNRSTQKSIALSEVISTVNGSLESKPKTDNILIHLPSEKAELVIRFRNSEDGPEGYINNYSYLTLVYD